MKLGAGQVMTQVCTFIRSVIVARLISPENYGIAALFATTFVLLEQVSNLAADKLLIQAKDGDEPAFQRSAQLVMLGRGLSNATVLLVLAGPFSRLFGAPQAVWAFRCLALLPLTRAFIHLDMNRLQRHLRFGPAVLVDVSANVLAALAALPLALWFRNYWAMLWVLVVQQGSITLGSHVVAERRYGVAWNKEFARRMFHFGWPLLVNGLLLYGIMEGDRMVIGSAKRLFAGSTYTLTDLGIYSVAFSISYAPATLIFNVTGSLFLPILSRVKEALADFEKTYRRCLNSASLLAAMSAIPFIVAGGWVVSFVYGQKYAAAGGFIGWLGAMWGVRIIRTVPTLAAVAQGDTKTSMLSNIVRSLALLGMVLAAASGAGLAWISISGFCGESLALGMALWRLKRLHAIPGRLCLKPFAVIGLGMIVGSAVSAATTETLGAAAALLGSIGISAATFLAMLLVIPELRLDFRAAIATALSRLRTNVKVATQV
jgi:O-antigen/teichoic acid export membrane protein